MTIIPASSPGLFLDPSPMVLEVQGTSALSTGDCACTSSPSMEEFSQSESIINVSITYRWSVFLQAQYYHQLCFRCLTKQLVQMPVDALECCPTPYRTYMFSCLYLSHHCCPLLFCILFLNFLFLSYTAPNLCYILAPATSWICFETLLCFLLHHQAPLAHWSPPRWLSGLSLPHQTTQYLCCSSVQVWLLSSIQFVPQIWLIHTIRFSCLHARNSRLNRIQSGFNPHPEVGYVTRFPNRVSAFTRKPVKLNPDSNPG